jgi:hypothetical protein
MGKKKVLRKQLELAMDIIELQEESLILTDRYWRCSKEYREGVAIYIAENEDKIYALREDVEALELYINLNHA